MQAPCTDVRVTRYEHFDRGAICQLIEGALVERRLVTGTQELPGRGTGAQGDGFKTVRIPARPDRSVSALPT